MKAGKGMEQQLFAFLYPQSLMLKMSLLSRSPSIGLSRGHSWYLDIQALSRKEKEIEFEV